MRILVAASTFPAHDDDPVPAFVRDQVIALKKYYPDDHYAVLAPHDKRSQTKSFTRHECYDEYRFHYFWPFSLEKLAGRGIMPALKANPLNYLLIPFLFIGEFIALLRLTRRLKPDILYAHWFTPQAITARLVSFFTRTPFVFTTHASDVDVWHKIPTIGKSIVRHTAARAQAITAVSSRSMGKLEAFFSPGAWRELRQRTIVIPMGIDLPAAAKKSRKKSAAPTIVFVGRLAEKKGVQYLLPAFAALQKELPKTRLTIGGDGPMLSSLKAQAKELGVSNSVSFPGYVSGSDKHTLIASSDVYVVPSIITKSGDAEGLPVSLMEGLSYGNICVATFESGADDILRDGKDGFLIPQKDSNALEKALKKALTLSTDDRRQMSVAATQTAQQFAWPKIARRYHEFFFTNHHANRGE